MMHTNFTPGPSQLYFTVSDHARRAFRDGVPSLSHRSKQFEAISREATDGIRSLLSVPADHHIFFTGSATEIWERIIQNTVEKKSLHLVNGSFSRRFFEISGQLGKAAVKVEAPEGHGFAGKLNSDDAEVVAVTHNETSTGVSLPLEFIHSIKANNPNALVAVDAVSSLPYPAFDFNHIDSLFFSVQKGFGLPAGLGVWIVNERCVEKANTLLNKGVSIGSYHNIPSLLSHAKKNQTPETPNVLSIYLLGRIIGDFLRRGIDAIRRETDYKAAVLYQALDQHPVLSAFVQEPPFRSKTVIVANTGTHTEKVAAFLADRGLMAGDGYGANKKTQLRFANFPAHSREVFDLLADSLKEYTG